MHIHIINGPNLNLLGKREVDIYGNQNFESYIEKLKQDFSTHTLTYFQSNIEGELVNNIQEFGFTANGIVINPAAYSHTSLAMADAIAAINCPVVEVHISNIFAREAYRHHSFISSKVRGVISGLGLEGYRLGIEYLISI